MARKSQPLRCWPPVPSDHPYVGAPSVGAPCGALPPGGATLHRDSIGEEHVGGSCLFQICKLHLDSVAKYYSYLVTVMLNCGIVIGSIFWYLSTSSFVFSHSRFATADFSSPFDPIFCILLHHFNHCHVLSLSPQPNTFFCSSIIVIGRRNTVDNATIVPAVTCPASATFFPVDTLM